MRHQKVRCKYYNTLIPITQNFGYALSQATGDYIFLSDQDDVWYQNKLEKCIDALQEHAYCVHDFDVIDANGNYKNSYRYKDYSIWQAFWRGQMYGFTIGMRASVVERFLPMPLIPQHDTMIAILAKLQNDIGYIHEPLAGHRVFSDQRNNSNNGFAVPFPVKLLYRIKLIMISLFRYYSFAMRDRFLMCYVAHVKRLQG